MGTGVFAPGQVDVVLLSFFPFFWGSSSPCYSDVFHVQLRLETVRALRDLAFETWGQLCRSARQGGQAWHDAE